MRRWAVRVLAVALALVAATFGTASLLTGRSQIARALVWMEADVDPIPLPMEPGPLPTLTEQFLSDTETTALVVLRDGVCGTRATSTARTASRSRRRCRWRSPSCPQWSASRSTRGTSGRWTTP